MNTSDTEILIFAQREPGTLLARMGHDIKIRVTDFEIDTDLEGGEISARMNATSFEPVDAIKWEDKREIGELSDGDRHEIKQRMDKKVLDVDEFPEVVFRSTTVEPNDDGWHVEGTLELHGEAHDIDFDVQRQDERAHVETVIDHTRWGIEQYSAMMGSLKVSPELVIVVDAPLPG